MKFCPYCGAEILDNGGSFCAECGKTLPTGEKSDASAGRQRQRKKRVTKKKSLADLAEKNADNGYDGYYEDVLPDDDGAVRQTLDKTILKNITVLILALFLVVGLCVAVMYLM